VDSAPRTLLLVGYGNDSRRDDGVAAHILRGLLATLGVDAHIGGEYDVDCGARLKAMFLHQLAPELAEVAAAYDTVVFIDAHVDTVEWDPVSWRPVDAVVEAGMLGHHLKPGVIVALAETLYGRRPTAYLLSVLGHDFDFGEILSAETADLAEQAVARLQELVRSHGLASEKC
jgi:hydrogenase maturation protease